jgi:hypothetical protein
MMKREWDLLFSEYDLRAVLENQLRKVNDEVRAIAESQFDVHTDEYLAASVASRLVVSPIELREDAITVSSREVKVDVSYDPDRHFFEPGPHYVDGVEVTYHLPYGGDKTLFRCQPSQYTLNPPRAIVKDGELRFPYDDARRNIAVTKKELEQDLSTLKQWVPWVNAQVVEYNASLEQAVRIRVQARRNELQKTKNDLGSLGFPVRNDKPSTRPAATADLPTRRASRRQAARRQYDVALSFAGEDREFVEAVAQSLKDAGVSVFYDGFETVDLWGKDLVEHLGKVYSEDSHFVVMFVSRHYAEKAWPTHERQFALSRALKGDKERILPVRMDDTEIPGLAPTIAYLDVRVLTPSKLAELIRQKLDAE